MGAIFTAILPVILRLLGMTIDKYIKNEEARNNFIKFVESVAINSESPKLKTEYEKQLEELKRRWQESPL